MARPTKKGARGDGALGERIRRRRKALGLTAKDLAQSAGVSASYVSQLEHGKQDRPSLDVLAALTQALGVSASELIGDDIVTASAASLPAALVALADELGLDRATTAMLGAIHVEGRQPLTRQGWLLIWLAIEHACYDSARLPRAQLVDESA